MIYETTLPVGDTRKRFGPMLEEGSGPHGSTRILSSRSARSASTSGGYSRICDGTRRSSAAPMGRAPQKAAAFYAAVLDAEVTRVENAETAEFSKLAETTYRDVNIALANEFARYAEGAGIDVLQAIEAANSQPFSHIHTPGAGVGGHCIPVYPYFFANRASDARLTQLSRQINDDMARHARGPAEPRRSMGWMDGASPCSDGHIGKT